MCVAAGTPGGRPRCGWTSTSSTTTRPGRRLRGRPLEGRWVGGDIIGEKPCRAGGLDTFQPPNDLKNLLDRLLSVIIIKKKSQ